MSDQRQAGLAAARAARAHGPGGPSSQRAAGLAAAKAARGGKVSASTPQPRKRQHGVGGFFHNLAHGAGVTIAGAGPAVAHLAVGAGKDVRGFVYNLQHPRQQTADVGRTGRNVAAIGASYAQRYGPLVHGHLGQFGQNVYNDPFSFGLDVLPVAGAAGKALSGTRLATAGRMIELRSPRAVMGDATGPVARRSVSPKPLHGHAQLAADKLLKRVAPYAYQGPNPAMKALSVVGEGKRYARHETSRSFVEARNLEARATPHMQTIAKLHRPERVATFLRETLPDPASLRKHIEALKARGEISASKAARILENKKVQELYHAPNDRIHAAHAAIKELRGQHEFVLGDLLDQESAAVRPYLHEMLARGGKFEPSMTPPSRTLVRSRRRVIKLEQRFETAKRKRVGIPYPPVREAGQLVSREVPRTAAEAEARAEHLQKWVDKRVKVIYDELRAIQPTRTVSKDYRPRKIQTEADKFKTHAIGTGTPLEQPLKPIKRVEGKSADWGKAEKRIYELGKKEGAHPALAQIAAKMDELDHLKGLILANRDAPIFGHEAPGYGTVKGKGKGRTPATFHPSDMPPRIAKGGPGVNRIGGALSLAREELQALEARHAGAEPHGPLAYVGPSAGAVKAELAGRGLPEPGYLPDKPALKPSGTYGGARKGAQASGPPRMPGELKQNHGVLFLAGQLAHDPRSLNEAFLNAVRFAHRNDLWNRGWNAGEQVPLSELDRIPAGMVAMREPVGARIGMQVAGKTQTVASGSKSLPQLVRSAADFDKWAQEHLDDLQSGTSTENSLFTHDLERAAKTGTGHVVLLPAGVAKTLTGEFRSQSTLIRLVNTYPMRVWRTLVLGLRPAWLVNNVLGNTFMYLMQNSGPKGLGALATSFREMIHPGSRGEFDALMRQHFGAQLGGTFVGTAGSLTRFSGLAKFDRAYEQMLRKASVKTYLQKHPVVRARVKEMQAETHSFWHAAGHVLDKDPELARIVEQQVNDALGNFSNLSRVEQSYIRAFFPFYAWYRAITAVVLKLPLTAPVKTALLGRLGAIQGEQNLAAQGYGPGEGPAWKAAYLPIGKQQNGRLPTIGFQGLNPYETVPQLAEATAGLVASRSPREIGRSLGLLAPEFGAGVAATTGKNPVTGQPYHSIPGGLFTNVPWAIGVGLPQSTLTASLLGRRPANTTSSGRRRFTEHTWNADLLRFLGAPYNNIATRQP